MATIYDVARLAGVSPATVSRVLNGATVSPEKSEAVRAAATALAFTPSRAARALRTQSTEVIALVIPDIENPYFTEVARGVEDVAQEAGYSLVLCNSDGRAGKEATYLDVAVSERMAGVLIAAAGTSTDVAPVLAAGHAVVAVDRTLGPDVDAVIMANRDAGMAATANLIEAGFRRIACITGPEQVETARGRAEGWRDALAAHGLPHDGLLRYSTFHVDGGRSALADLLDSADPPDAVVAANNLLGVGTMQLLAERRLAPPAVGVAVVGSLPFTTVAPSAVSVVRLPARHMGATAARLLLDRIAGSTAPARTIVLRGELQPASDPFPHPRSYLEGSP